MHAAGIELSKTSIAGGNLAFNTHVANGAVILVSTAEAAQLQSRSALSIDLFTRAIDEHAYASLAYTCFTGVAPSTLLAGAIFSGSARPKLDAARSRPLAAVGVPLATTPGSCDTDLPRVADWGGGGTA